MENSPQLPEPLPFTETEQLRQRLAGLVDPSEKKQQWYADYAKGLAIRFCASLPEIFGESLDRLTMWDKIPAAIQSAYAKTIGGDIEMFVQHVAESIQAEPRRAIACDNFTEAMSEMSDINPDHRQDFLEYMVTHLIPILVHAKRLYRTGVDARKAEKGRAE